MPGRMAADAALDGDDGALSPMESARQDTQGRSDAAREETKLTLIYAGALQLLQVPRLGAQSALRCTTGTIGRSSDAEAVPQV